MSSSLTYYELLGISPSADSTELRSAFRNLSKELHPDTTSLPHEEAAKRFQQVCEAYELLNDPQRRQAYDLSIKEDVNSSKYVPDPFGQIENGVERKNLIGQRRPLSGGELFSLTLLAIALLLSLFLALTFALLRGRELYIYPSWLVIWPSLERFYDSFYRCLHFH